MKIGELHEIKNENVEKGNVQVLNRSKRYLFEKIHGSPYALATQQARLQLEQNTI